MKKFENIYLFTDIDGTLASTKDFIPQKNLDAIKYFTENGGIFSIATGRYFGDLEVLKNININGLSILNNGASIYDFISKKEIQSVFLSENTCENIHKFSLENKDLGLLVVNSSGYHTAVIDDEKRPVLDERYVLTAYENLQAPFAKMLIVVNDDNANLVIEKLENLNLTEANFVRTGERSIEITPKNVSKGKAFLKICEMKKIPQEKTFFCGDSFNDVEMMDLSNFSGAVLEAKDEVKKHADVVLCEFENSAVAQMIEIIEKGL